MLFHNGIKVFEFEVLEKRIWIPGDFLSETIILKGSRGAITDMQVWSSPLDEKQLEDWTTCRNNISGNVYQWNVDTLNMTHDERMISTIEKVNRKSFCKVKAKEIHIIGQGNWDISLFDSMKICKRLNGEIVFFPKDEEAAVKIKTVLIDFMDKANLSEIQAWVGGRARIETFLETPYAYPYSSFWDVEDPETGELLLNDQNRKYLATVYHSYKILKDLCLAAFVAREEWLLAGKKYFYTWEKCEREIWGRVLCEFDDIPIITIKGFCSKELMDKKYQLIDVKPGQGKTMT